MPLRRRTNRLKTMSLLKKTFPFNLLKTNRRRRYNFHVVSILLGLMMAAFVAILGLNAQLKSRVVSLTRDGSVNKLSRQWQSRSHH